MESEEWQKILGKINSADDLNSNTVIDKIKEILKVEHPDVYERWGEGAYEGWGEVGLEFDIDYLFQYEEFRRPIYMFTLLHASVSYKLISTLKALLAAGANVNASDIDENTPLHLAALFGHIDIVNLLLQEGAAVHARDRHNKTPLHWAAQNGYIEIIEILLENGANINAVTKDKETPLHYAALSDYADIVNLLLENGAEVNAIDKRNKTALHWSAGNEHIDVVRTLLKHKAIPSLRDSYDQTPMSLTWNNEIKQLLHNSEGRNVTAWAMPVTLTVIIIISLAVFMILGTVAYKAFEPSTEVDEVNISDKVSKIIV